MGEGSQLKFRFFLKIITEFVTTLLLLFTLWRFGCEAHGILAPQQGIEPASPALECKNLNHWPTRAVPKMQRVEC